MLSSRWREQRVGACTDCRRLWADFRAGRLNQAEIDAVNDRLVPSVGTCSVMGTASTMALLMEVMGLTAPGAASAPAVSADRMRIAERTGWAAARLARGEVRMPQIGMPQFKNALRLLLAAGGSTNALVHLAAIMGRLGLSLDPQQFNDIAATTPVLVDLKPGGEGYMPDLHEAGGLARLLVELTGLLDLDLPTVSGDTLADRLHEVDTGFAQSVVRGRDQPIYPGEGLKWLQGNLAPAGALIKPVAATPALLEHTGRAVVPAPTHTRLRALGNDESGTGALRVVLGHVIGQDAFGVCAHARHGGHDNAVFERVSPHSPWVKESHSVSFLRWSRSGNMSSRVV
jgi:dihydroxy-acid dehydratase